MNASIQNHIYFKDVLLEAEELRWKKYQAYGNSYREFGLLGIAIKMNDKVSRINNLMKNKDKDYGKSIRDSAIDLLNYAAMFIMEYDGKK